MQTFRVRTLSTERFRNAIWIMAIANVLLNLLYRGDHLLVSMILFAVSFLGVVLYSFVLHRQSQVTLSESHLTLGQRAWESEQIERIRILRSRNLVLVDFLPDQRTVRSRFKVVSLRPLTNAEEFYREFTNWAENHQVSIVESK